MKEKINKLIAWANRPVFKQFGLLEILALLARIVLGIIFLLASYDKILNNHAFALNVTNYHMLPTSLVSPFAFILPWVELITGLYLVLGVFTKITAMFAIFLLLVFIAALSYALITNQPVTACGCFSQNPTDTIGWIDVFRDVGFIILAILILLPPRVLISIDTLIQFMRNPQGEADA